MAQGEANYSYETNNTSVPGDNVLYDWFGTGSYEHVGILTVVSGMNRLTWTVAGTMGMIPYFNWGAAECPVSFFQHIQHQLENGEVVTGWSNCTIKIVRLKQ